MARAAVQLTPVLGRAATVSGVASCTEGLAGFSGFAGVSASSGGGVLHGRRGGAFRADGGIRSFRRFGCSGFGAAVGGDLYFVLAGGVGVFVVCSAVTDDSFFFVGAFGIYTGILRGTVGIRQRSIALFAGALGGLLRSFLPGLVGRSTQGGVIHSRAGDGGGIVVAAADSAAGIGFLCGIGDGQVVVGQRGGRQNAGYGDGLFACAQRSCRLPDGNRSVQGRSRHSRHQS